MAEKDSPTQAEPKPIQDTTKSNEENSEHKADTSASLPVVYPHDTEAEKPYPDESEEETDRKQDESIASLAEQTEWIARQTKWVRVQTIASMFLGAVTLAVLIYHGLMMRGQLESMQSSSAQTQQMIGAMQKQADASQTSAERNRDLVRATQSLIKQNRELIEYTGEQAKASTIQANASLMQAKAANKSLGFAQSSARAAERSAQASEQSLTVGTRAYLFVRTLTMSKPEGKKPALITLTYANEGKLPAYVVYYSIRYSVGTPSWETDPQQEWRGNLDRFIEGTPANIEWERQIRRRRTYGSREYKPSNDAPFLPTGEAQTDVVATNFTDEEISKIYSHTESLFVEVTFTYQDGLGNIRDLHHCFIFLPYYGDFVSMDCTKK